MKQDLYEAYEKEQDLVQLPVGVTEFEAWASNIISLSGLPDNDSMRFSLAAMIQHLGPTEDRKSNEFFVRSLRKAAANQVAGHIFYELKEKQKKEAEEAKKRAEEAATAATEAGSSGNEEGTKA